MLRARKFCTFQHPKVKKALNFFGVWKDDSDTFYSRPQRGKSCDGGDGRIRKGGKSFSQHREISRASEPNRENPFGIRRGGRIEILCILHFPEEEEKFCFFYAWVTLRNWQHSPKFQTFEKFFFSFARLRSENYPNPGMGMGVRCCICFSRDKDTSRFPSYNMLQ